MKHSTLYIKVAILFLIVLITACQDDFTNGNNDTGKLVVDGYIENGQKARVVLTFSIPIDSEIDSSKYLDIVTTRATVKVFAGDISELLTLRWNKDAFPQHYYESEKIKGKEGESYSIEVYYLGDTLRATTTIPSAILLDSVWTTMSEKDSLKRYLWVKFCDNPDEHNYYRFFTKIVGKQQQFVPTYLASIDDVLFNGECNEISLSKGVENFFETDREDVFDIGDSIVVKAAAIDKATFEFWKNYEKEIFNVGNPFSGNGSNLVSNIQGNGIGIWCGYNSNTYPVTIK